MSFECTQCPGGFAVTITGLDLGQPIPAATAQALRQAWLEHGVLVCPGLGTGPEEQLALSRCFGALEPHPIERFRMPGWPELILLGNENGPSGPIYDFGAGPVTQRIPWHTDLAFTTTPNAGALLRMVRRPASGGETGWIDTAAAYDALDAATRAEIDGLEAVYHFRAGLEEMRFHRPDCTRLSPRAESYPDFPPVANPLVWVHPETGRKMLNLSLLNIERVLGLPEAESAALIERLLAHVLQPRFQYIHHWRENDMVLWDNRRTLHSALGHPADQIRVVHRTTIKGTVAMGRMLETTEQAA